MLIVVTTVALGDGGGEIAPPELIARGVGEDLDLIDDLRDEAERIARELARDGITEIKLVQEHIHDGIGQVVYDRTRRRPDDPSDRDRGMSLGWPDVLAASGVRDGDHRSARRAAPRLRGGGDRVLPAARALGQGRRGASHARGATGRVPSRGRPRRDRARGPRAPALHLPARARARPRGGAVVVRRARRRRARRVAAGARAGGRHGLPEPRRRRLPRARGARPRAPGPRGRRADGRRRSTGRSLWAGLFDLRDTLLGTTVDDLRALAA